MILGSVELIKVDEDDHKRTLQGAEFKLKDESGNIVQSELITDKDGKLVVEN